MLRHTPHAPRARTLRSTPATTAVATPEAALPAAPPGRAPLLPLGALAAGFGLLSVSALAQVQAPATAASAPAKAETTLAPIPVKAKAETDASSVRAITSTIGKGNQEVRDIPQSLTVVTKKLMDDRQIDTLKEALHNTAGISFLAAEGGEEDIRLRGFSLAASGDIYADSLRDPAFYERDTFSYDRIELLRGSASMLFGRGSTGGVVNQVSKQPLLTNVSEIELTGGSGNYGRFTGDFNLKTSERSALRINVMKTDADNDGNKIDKQGFAPTFRWGIGTNDEFSVGLYYLHNNNGINYGMPYLRVDASTPVGSVLVPVDPKNYYGAASDYNAGGATLGTFTQVHRFADGGELKSAIRHGSYERDQRASTIRFFTNANPANGPIFTTPTLATINNNTPLTRGTNNKRQDMTTTYAQSDYSNKFNGFGMRHEILTGLDAAKEEFNAYALTLPAGVTLDKNTPRTTLGTPNDGTSVDEGRRSKLRSGNFDAKSLGLYAQDLVQVAPDWKILAGLRWDKFSGHYRTYSTATSATVPVIGTETANRARSDSLWSKRFGVLYQPNEKMSFHFSYGTSFNTSGDTYQYDTNSAQTPPEGSRNYELGAKIDALDGRVSIGAALFHSTKFNERNRDPDQPAGAYLLSGQRHAAGLELDLAGRITPQWEVFASYAYIPDAKIDKGVGGADLTGERVGDRPSLTPRHSGTLWTTYQVLPNLRVGGGLNARGSQTPNRNPVGIVAPHYVTGDLLAEYSLTDAVVFKLNVNNVTNKLYADSLYTAHYIPGAPRTVRLSMNAKF